MEFNSESAVAIARLVATMASAIAATFGWAYDADLWFNVTLSVLAIALLCYSWWKNNNLTAAAQASQEVLMHIKRGQSEEAEVVKFIKAKESAEEVEEKDV